MSYLLEKPVLLINTLHAGGRSNFAVIAPLTCLEGSPLGAVRKGLGGHTSNPKATSFTFSALFGVFLTGI